MYVENVFKNNLEFLLDTIKEGLNTDENRKEELYLGRKVINVLDKISITFEVRDINALELFFLSRIDGVTISTDNTHIDTCDYFKEDNSDSKADKETASKIEEIYKYLKDVLVDLNREGKSLKESSMILPVYSLKYDADITFTGESLTYLLECSPSFSVFYVKYMDEKTNKNDYLIDRFVKLTYIKMNELISTNVDILSDFVIKEKYLKTSDISDISFNSLNTPYGVCSELPVLLNFAETLKKKYSDKSSSFIKTNTFLIFTCNGTFATFLDMVQVLPKYCVIDHTDLKILRSEGMKYTIPKEVEPVKSTITALMDSVSVETERYFAASKSRYLQSFGNINLNCPIVYSIRISLDDIERFIIENINYIKKDISESDVVFTNTKEFLDKLEFILKWGSTIYSAIK